MTKVILGVLAALSLTACVSLEAEAEPVTAEQKKHIHCFTAATAAGDNVAAAKHKSTVEALGTHPSNIEFELGYSVAYLDVVEESLKLKGTPVPRATLGQKYYEWLKCDVSGS